MIDSAVVANPANILRNRAEEESRIKELLAAPNGSINKMWHIFYLLQLLPSDMHAEHSVINISADNGVTSH